MNSDCVMGSRRYSLPSLRQVRLGFGALKKKQHSTTEDDSGNGIDVTGDSNGSWNLLFDGRGRRNTSSRGNIGNTPLSATESKLLLCKRIISSTHPGHCRQLPGQQQLYQIFGNRRVDRLNSKIDCDEVYPNLLIGNEGAAKNKAYLKLIGVTHVVNCAEGVHFCQINTGSYFYSDHNIKYMGLNVLDVPQAKISIHFAETADFIERALMTGGKVFVHCMVGLSRSATIVIAYLMIKRGISLEECIRCLRRNREVRPNDGFLRQLIELEYTLSTSSHFSSCNLHFSSHPGSLGSLGSFGYLTACPAPFNGNNLSLASLSLAHPLKRPESVVSSVSNATTGTGRIQPQIPASSRSHSQHRSASSSSRHSSNNHQHSSSSSCSSQQQQQQQHHHHHHHHSHHRSQPVHSKSVKPLAPQPPKPVSIVTTTAAAASSSPLPHLSASPNVAPMDMVRNSPYHSASSVSTINGALFYSQPSLR